MALDQEAEVVDLGMVEDKVVDEQVEQGLGEIPEERKVTAKMVITDNVRCMRCRKQVECVNLEKSKQNPRNKLWLYKGTCPVCGCVVCKLGVKD
jgi:ABC-type uncharacterized transport system ATPase subunit